MKRLLMALTILGALPLLSHADINVTPGTGKVVPSDTVGGKEYQQIKIVDGVVGSTAAAQVDPVGGLLVRLTTGTASVGTVQVQGLYSGTTVQVVSSTIQVNVGNIVPVTGTFFQTNQPVQITTGGVTAVVVSTVQVNLGSPIPAGSNTIGGVTGTFWQTNQPVSITTGGVTAVITSTIQVNMGSPIPAGTNTIGTVAATQSGAWSVSPGTGVYRTDGSGFTQPVSGTVASTQSGAWSVSPGTGVYRTDGSGFTQPISGSIGNSSFGSSQSGVWTTTVTFAGASQPANLFAIGGTPQSGANVIDTGNTAIRVNVVAGGGAGGGTSSSFGGLFPAAGTAGGYFGANGNLQGASVNASSSVYVFDVSSPNVQGLAVSGAIIAGNPVPSGVFVSSSSLPGVQSDGDVIYNAGTNIGQQLVTGVPWGVTFSTYAAWITSATTNTNDAAPGAESVLVSSPPASQYTYLCGCVFTNTTATNGAVVIESPYGQTTNRMAIGVPANYVPSGTMPGCMNPFFRSAASAKIWIYQTVASSNQNVYMKCNYYQGP